MSFSDLRKRAGTDLVAIQVYTSRVRCPLPMSIAVPNHNKNTKKSAPYMGGQQGCIMWEFTRNSKLLRLIVNDQA